MKRIKRHIALLIVITFLFMGINVEAASLGKTALTLKSRTSNTVTLKIKKVSSATGYRIYRATKKDGKYSYLGKTTKLSYQDKKATSTKTYYYKARAYKTKNGKNTYGSYANVLTVKPVKDNTTVLMNEVVKLVNKEREKAGLSVYKSDKSLNKAALTRAKEITKVFDHNRPDGSSFYTVAGEFDISYKTIGENIAYGQPTPEAVVKAWMNSAGHKANILNKNFNKIGIGVYKKGSTIYWVQLFTN